MIVGDTVQSKTDAKETLFALLCIFTGESTTLHSLSYVEEGGSGYKINFPIAYGYRGTPIIRHTSPVADIRGGRQPA